MVLIGNLSVQGWYRHSPSADGPFAEFPKRETSFRFIRKYEILYFFRQNFKFHFHLKHYGVWFGKIFSKKYLISIIFVKIFIKNEKRFDISSFSIFWIFPCYFFDLSKIRFFLFVFSIFFFNFPFSIFRNLIFRPF